MAEAMKVPEVSANRTVDVGHYLTEANLSLEQQVKRVFRGKVDHCPERVQVTTLPSGLNVSIAQMYKDAGWEGSYTSSRGFLVRMTEQQCTDFLNSLTPTTNVRPFPAPK